MNFKNNKLISTLLICFLITLSYPIKAEEVNDVIVKGNKRIEEATVTSYAEIEYGKNYTNKDLDKIINNLYAQGFFKNIKAYIEEDKLYLELEENPLISNINLPKSRLSSSNEETIRKEIPLKEGSILNTNLLEKTKDIIAKHFRSQGYYGTEVTYKTHKQDQNRVNVDFDVKKGKQAGIKRIYFVGNSRFDGNKLKKVIQTNEMNFFAKVLPQEGALTKLNATYSKSRLEYDKTLLEEFYKNQGYVNFKVKSIHANLDEDRQNFTLTYVLDEGPTYKLSDWKINSSSLDVDKKILNKKVNLKLGKIYHQSDIDEAKEAIASELRERGYAFAEVEYNVHFDHPNRTVVVEFNATETNKFYIGNIVLLGNNKTYDHVIRREMLISEGDPFIHSKIQKSVRNIYGLGYFKSNLDVKPKPSSCNKDNADIYLDLEEASTLSVSLSGAWGTEGGINIDLSFDEKNLLGKGYKFNTNIQHTIGEGSNFSLGVVNPYFYDKDLLLGSKLIFSRDGSKKDSNSSSDNNTNNTDSNSTYDKSNYTSDLFKPSKIQFKLYTGYNIIEDLNQRITYSLTGKNLKFDEQYELDKQNKKSKEDTQKKTEKQIKNESILELFKESEKKKLVSSIDVNSSLNKVDNLISPKYGYKINNSFKFAGLSGNTYNWSDELSFQIFHSFYDEIFRFELDVDFGLVRGWNGQDTIIDDRFGLGFDSFRGFDKHGVGPRIVNSNSRFNDKALLGKNKFKASGELDFPIASDSSGIFALRGAFFIDIGATWGVDIPEDINIKESELYHGDFVSASIGVGFNVNNPLIPGRVYFGLPLRKSKYDKPKIFTFSTNIKL